MLGFPFALVLAHPLSAFVVGEGVPVGPALQGPALPRWWYAKGPKPPRSSRLLSHDPPYRARPGCADLAHPIEGQTSRLVRLRGTAISASQPWQDRADDRHGRNRAVDRGWGGLADRRSLRSARRRCARPRRAAYWTCLVAHLARRSGAVAEHAPVAESQAAGFVAIAGRTTRHGACRRQLNRPGCAVSDRCHHWVRAP